MQTRSPVQRTRGGAIAHRGGTEPGNPVPGRAVSSPATLVRRAQADPRSLGAADVRRLHRMVGNRSVGALLGRQANVAVGPPASAWGWPTDPKRS